MTPSYARAAVGGAAVVSEDMVARASIGLLLVLCGAACKDDPGTQLARTGPRPDAQEVIRIPPPPDAAPVASWEPRDLSQVTPAGGGAAPFKVKMDLPTTATVSVRVEGGTTAVADVNAMGVAFTMQELARPGTFDSVKKTIEPRRLRLAEKEPGGHTFVYADADDGSTQIVSVTRGKILCGAAGLDDASSRVVLRACRSIR
jgi:hypothetical protein